MTDLLTPRQVAKRYKVSSDTVRNWIETEELRAIHVGGTTRKRWAIPPDSLEEFEERRSNRPAIGKVAKRNKPARSIV